jgi:ribonucleotide monophosphatase NagD (HAD superfamily)
VHEIQTGLQTRFIEMYPSLPSVDVLMMTNVDIHAIATTIENYENRTVTLIFVSNNSVQSTVTNNNSIQQTVIDLAP